MWVRKDGRAVARYPVGRDAAGRISYATSYHATLAAAEAARARAVAQFTLGLAPPDQRPLEQYLATWLETVIRPTRTLGTYLSYQRTLRQHVVPTLGAIPLGRLTRDDVQRLLNAKAQETYARRRRGQKEEQRPLAPVTVGNIRSVLRAALAPAVRDGLIPRNPAALAGVPSAPPRPYVVLSTVEARALLAAAAGERLGALFVVALAVGLRRGEAFGLRWVDVDLERGRLRVVEQRQWRKGRGWVAERPKAASSGEVPLPAFAVAVLRVHRERQEEERQRARAWVDHGLVFCGRRGQPLDEGTMRLAWTRILTAAGLAGRGLRPHDLRHSAGTLLHAQGADLATIMATLRHRTPAMALRYIHSLAESQQAAAERMDRALTGRASAVKPAVRRRRGDGKTHGTQGKPRTDG